MNFFKWLILATILSSPFIYKLSQKYFQAAEIDEKKFLLEVYPEANLFSQKLSTPPHYKVYNKTNVLIGVIFLTSDIFPGINGYAGPIKILVGMNKNGIITGIKIISHSETPSYTTGITQDWFYNQYKGLTLENKFEIGKDVDGISRATISVASINKAIKKSTRLIGEKIFNIPAPKEEETIYLDMLINRDIPLLSGLFLIAIIAYKLKKKALRNFSLILGIIYLGFYRENFLSIVNILNILFWKLPDLSTHFLWYILIAGILITTFLWGRLYCYYLCPFGSCQEFIYSINRLKTVPPRIEEEKARLIKYVILWIIVLVTSITGNFFLIVYEPFSTLFGLTGSILAWSLVILVLLASFVYNRFWCKYFCAVGAALDFLSKFKKTNLR